MLLSYSMNVYSLSVNPHLPLVTQPDGHIPIKPEDGGLGWIFSFVFSWMMSQSCQINLG